MMRPSAKWVKIGILPFLVGGLLLGGLFLSEFFLAPHMKVQPSYKTFEAQMPMPPEGIVPIDFPPAPGEDRFTEAVPATVEILARSKVYYQYYCLFCHGEEGRGDGPVGKSYMPPPPDLQSSRILGYSDDRLVKAMLTGVGHDPVLPRVVPREYRRWLVPFVRQLAGGKDLHLPGPPEERAESGK